jgi:energy-coupling factor transporter ATP-binding protein EcfA2
VSGAHDTAMDWLVARAVHAEALFTTPAVDSFVRRIELGIADGGSAMLTGDPGTGKSITLRLLAERLRALPGVLVGTVEHPQSRTMDFYRELADLFAVPLASHNRWAGFKALRARWSDHIASSRCRPVLIIDEAQEALTTVLCELRILASKELDSKQLSCVVFAGDARLPERLRRVSESSSVSGSIWKPMPTTAERAQCSRMLSGNLPASTPLVSTSAQLTTLTTAPLSTTTRSTYSAPGSLLSKTRRADASRTTLLTLGFSPSFFDELVGKPSAGRTEHPSKASHGVADRQDLQLARFIRRDDQAVPLAPAEPRDDRLREPHLSARSELDRFGGRDAVRLVEAYGAPAMLPRVRRLPRRGAPCRSVTRRIPSARRPTKPDHPFGYCLPPLEASRLLTMPGIFVLAIRAELLTVEAADAARIRTPHLEAVTPNAENRRLLCTRRVIAAQPASDLERKRAHLRFFDDARRRFNHPPPGSVASAPSFRPKRFIILRTVALSLSACRDI